MRVLRVGGVAIYKELLLIRLDEIIEVSLKDWVVRSKKLNVKCHTLVLLGAGREGCAFWWCVALLLERWGCVWVDDRLEQWIGVAWELFGNKFACLMEGLNV